MRPVWLLFGLMGIGTWLVGQSAVSAQDRRFPYEAVLDVDEDYARCGPGPKYYPTSRLKRGERVTVHRHDPGGWAMIAPPADSFSWIQAEYVQKAASGRGSLTANNVIVHVGSSLGGERSVYQRMLSRGDTVEVLGEQTFVNDRGPVKMYKIKPPLREYRWIASKSILPADGIVNPRDPQKKPAVQQLAPFIQGPIASDLETKVAAEADAFDQSPFDPAAANPGMPRDTVANPVSTRRELPSGTDPGFGQDAAATTGEERPELEDLRQQLAVLDQQFRTLLQQDPQTWDLNALKQSYQKLEQAAQHPAFTSHVNQRLGTIQRYLKIQADYIDFNRLTSQTQQRDAELMTLQQQHQQRLQQLEASATAASGASSGLQPVPQGGLAANPTAGQFRQSPQLASLPSGGPAPEQGRQLAPANSELPTAQPAVPAAPGPRYSGAGIIQRSSITADGVPGYMLMSPDGRLLAYLEPAPGIDLSQAQNRAWGIIGDRSFRDQLQSDVIVVRGFQPVVLRTGPAPQ